VDLKLKTEAKDLKLKTDAKDCSSCSRKRNTMKILSVEDSWFLRTEIERALTKRGYEVISVADGREVLPLARSESPSLILLDMMLPGLDGTCVLKALKQDAVTAAIPVIILSGLSQRNEAKLRRSGAAAYVEKSSLGLDKSADALISVVETTIATSTRNRCAAEDRSPQPEARLEEEQTEFAHKGRVP
jgi:two-component system, cell cycle response regulator DivK